MILSPCRATLAVLTVVAAVPWPAHAGPPRRLERVVPADASMVVLLEDVPGLRRQWPDLPWVRAWNDPAMQAFFAPLRAAGGDASWDELMEGSSARVTEALELVTGQVALVIPDLSGLMQDDESTPAMALVAHVGANGDLFTELLRRPGGLLADDEDASDDDGDEPGKTEEDGEGHLTLREVTYRGTTLHLRQEMTEDGPVDRDGWAVVQGIAIMGEPRSLLESLVGGVLDGSGGMQDNPGFSRVRSRTGAASGLLFVNLGSMMQGILEMARQAPASQEPNPLGVTPEAVIRGLGLDALDAAFLSMQLGSAESRADMGLLAREERGLIKALAFMPPPAGPPSHLPADAVQASVTYFSVPAMWAAIKEMLQQVNPMLLGMLDAQVAQLSAQLGVDLEKSLIGGLGTSFSSAAFLTEPEAGEARSLANLQEVTALDITDPAGLDKALNALLGLFAPEESPFTTSQAGDVEIRTLNQALPSGPAGQERKLAYALTGNRLLVAQGGDDPIRRMLAAQAAPGPSIWSRPDVRTALAALPPGASAVSFTDSALLLDVLFETLIAIQAQQPAGDGDEEGFRMVDPGARPDPSAIRSYLGPAVSGAYKTSDSLFVTWRLSHAGP